MSASKKYCELLRAHYESHFGRAGQPIKWPLGPTEKLHPDFYILEIPPNDIHNMWAYLTVGMSLERNDENLIEVLIYSPEQNNSLTELLTITSSFHRNAHFLNLHHTVNIGQPWLKKSQCDHTFISLPYLDGEELELFNFEGKTMHCYWLIPITEKERDFKIKYGTEALEDLFEEKQIDFLNPERKCLIS